MNESRRAKKLSPFEVLRNEALEFIDSLVKWGILPSCSAESVTIFYFKLHKYGRNSSSANSSLSHLGVTCLPQSLRYWMKFATTLLPPLWDATSTQHLAPLFRLHSIVPSIIFRYMSYQVSILTWGVTESSESTCAFIGASSSRMTA